MHRRQFIQHASALAAAACAPGPLRAAVTGHSASTAPFQLLYSNDTTHILSCVSPWHSRADDFTEAHLQQSITEAAGVDVHLLQPGLGWIPWWQSKIYSPSDHYLTFLKEEHGVTQLNKIARYLLDGGDMLTTLVDTCRAMKVSPFLSFRLNDGHHVRDLAKALEQGRPAPSMSRHYWENYERFRLGKDVKKWDDGVFNWAIPEVRDYKFALLEEACTDYDLAGVELDFVRHWVRFGSDTSPDQRREITTAFVHRVRTMLDRTAVARGLPRRWLCVRVPARAEVRPEQGIDLKSLARTGVDMVNLSYSYFTRQDDSVRLACEELEDTAVYVEMTHTTMTGKALNGSGTQPYLRTTDQQFYTTAALAYEQGARGVSLFNFPYYREHQLPELGPFHEPPFHVLANLTDRTLLAQQPQWYFLSAGRNDPVLGKWPLPAILNRNQPQSFQMEMAPRRQHQRDGVLRLRSDESIADREFEVRFNGHTVKRIAHVAKPLPHRYDRAWLGRNDEIACFAIPAQTAVRGTNSVEIVVRKGIRVRLIYIDVTLPL